MGYPQGPGGGVTHRGLGEGFLTGAWERGYSQGPGRGVSYRGLGEGLPTGASCSYELPNKSLVYYVELSYSYFGLWSVPF